MLAFGKKIVKKDATPPLAALNQKVRWEISLGAILGSVSVAASLITFHCVRHEQLKQRRDNILNILRHTDNNGNVYSNVKAIAKDSRDQDLVSVAYETMVDLKRMKGNPSEYAYYNVRLGCKGNMNLLQQYMIAYTNSSRASPEVIRKFERSLFKLSLVKEAIIVEIPKQYRNNSGVLVIRGPRNDSVAQLAQGESLIECRECIENAVAPLVERNPGAYNKYRNSEPYKSRLAESHSDMSVSSSD